MQKRMKKLLCFLAAVVLTVCFFALPAAATGDVAGAVQSTWTTAQAQIKAIVNNVVFPVIDVVLVILFFVKVSTSYFEYRKHGQFEFAAPAILFACLVFTLTAPLYIWGVVGI
ncbi:DUF3852 domain-containing protein [Acutalibacter muris]|jgi:hypothetical protein|uniref:DUF3852 domain-containing protein n=1 Tax=Acutalibacter muris TaxID=1796620 RepID=UPI0026F3D598|nr:DUF3852 domain-containing protein [Acutalibacter muris]